MSDSSKDPAALWRDFLGEAEKNFNEMANRAMGSEHFSRAMNQAGGAGVGAQKAFGDMMERYLAGMNLPTRAQFDGMGERLLAIESQLNEIRALLYAMSRAAPAAESRDAVRPPRTRRPPSGSGGPAA